MGASVTSADSLSYSNFASTSGLTLNGSAASSGGNLVLASTPTLQAGSAFTNSAVNISQFTTSFQFQLAPVTSTPADGITFTIQGVGPTALGAFGGYLGYGKDTIDTPGNAGIANSIAIKFDDFFNNYDNGAQNVDPSDSTIGLLTNGNTPPGNDVSGSGIHLNTSDTFRAKLEYSGSTLSLDITDLNTTATASRSFNINIQSYVGGDTAYIGFTGGTGSFAASEQIENWSFNSPSITAAPLPSSLWGGLGLLGTLGAISARRWVRGK